jgi:transcription elongation factor Elf1
MTFLPARIGRKSNKAEKGRRSPAHRAWIRGFACSACGSTTAIECAHVRVGTDGGTGIKPSDKWCISLCKDCHAEQHILGEKSFEEYRGINMKALAETFFKNSPHRQKLEDRDA